MAEHHIKPGSPGDVLEHYGVKGMRWGVRKEEETSSRPSSSNTSTPAAQTRARKNSTRKQKMSEQLKQPTTSATKTDVIPGAQKAEKHGLTRNQKLLLTFGALTAAGAGYYAYKHYVGAPVPMPTNLPHVPNASSTLKQEARIVEGVGKLPAKWDVRQLPHRPISTQPLGDLAGGEFTAKLKDIDNLVVNTSRGYADILPKGGFDNPYAAEQHKSVVRALEKMREMYPSIRNMNVEVVPASKVQGMEYSNAYMSVMSMRAGEARVIYNDTMKKLSPEVIKANKDFLPGVGHKDYLAYHEMGHLLAVAHGEIPPGFDVVSGNAGPIAIAKWKVADSVLHKQMFARHGFTFKELSKLSQYAATEPAEAMAELHGHLMTPEMRKRLTADQIKRATAMFNEMGGLSE